MVLASEAFGKWLAYEGRTLNEWGLEPLQNGLQKLLHPPAMTLTWWKDIIYEVGSHQTPNLLDFPAYRTVRNLFISYSVSSILL